MISTHSFHPVIMPTYECAFRCINSIISLNYSHSSLLLLINSKFLKYNCLNVLLYVCVWLMNSLCVTSFYKVDFPLSPFNFWLSTSVALNSSPYYSIPPLLPFSLSKCTSNITYSFKLKSIPLFDLIESYVTNRVMHSTPTITIKQYDP